jgi:hypothetical protein
MKNPPDGEPLPATVEEDRARAFSSAGIGKK